MHLQTSGAAKFFIIEVFSPQVDLCAEEFHNSVQGSVSLLGDVKEVTGQLVDASPGVLHPSTSPWWDSLREKMQANTATNNVSLLGQFCD